MDKIFINVSRSGRTSKFDLAFQYNEEIIKKIKNLEKREWNAEKKVWVLESIYLYKLISLYKGREDIFFEFKTPEEKEFFKKSYKKKLIEFEKNEIEIANQINKQKEAIELKKHLLSLDKIDFDYTKYLNNDIIPYNYQIASALVAAKLGRTLIAADLGLGKTLIAILLSEILSETNNIKKILCIVPNNLKYNWVDEISKFTKQKSFVLESNLSKMKKNNIYSIEESKFIICNYDYFKSSKFSMKERFEKYGLKNFDMLIADECHKLKNPQANMVKNILKHIRPIVGENVALLSATPQQNAITDLFVNLHILSPLEFKSKSKFFTDWCGMRYDPRSFNGWSQISTPDYERLHEKLEGFMIRLKKSEYLKELPKVTIQKINIEMSDEQQKQYKAIEEGFAEVDWNVNNVLKGFDEQKNKSPLTIMGQLRQYVASIKLDTTIDLVEELNNENEKVVVFETFIAPLKRMKELVKTNSELYIGETDSFVRQELVKKFQEDNFDLKNLFISLGSGNAGITLTKASHMILNTLDYVPAINSQAIGRIDRIGQTKPITVFIPIVKGTIDEYVYEMVNNKQKIISKVIDGEDFIDNAIDTSSIVSDLMNLYKSKFGYKK